MYVQIRYRTVFVVCVQTYIPTYVCKVVCSHHFGTSIFTARAFVVHMRSMYTYTVYVCTPPTYIVDISLYCSVPRESYRTWSTTGGR